LQLTDDAFLGSLIPLPSPEEADAIVRFIAMIDRRVNRFIRNRRRLIEVLNEQKQAIINRAVTRGLDPNAPLKPSGIDWLGDVPEHWEIVPLKRSCVLVRDGTHLPPPRVSEGIPLLSVRNIVKGKFVLRDDDSMISAVDYDALSQSFVPQCGDVLLAIVGATMGKVAIVPKMERFHIQRSLAILRPNPHIITSNFLSHFLQSQRFQGLLWRTVAFSAQPGIYLGTIAAMPVPVPPLTEQVRTVDGLKVQLSPLLSSLMKAEQEIDLIREYRTRLIADVVTGKLDVRGLAPAESLPADEEIDDEETLENNESELDEEAEE
ncbi:MAG TPA: restriction endonuclease subunit S, partial [Planctomycetaceae bacterium]|nr:restriction endonuclease subunit S [Planctomycetaceae bacterium]